MDIGFIGLGKMGGNMAERLLNGGHRVVVYNLTKPEIEIAASKGAIPANSVEDLVKKLPLRKVVWLMVPSGKPVDENIDVLSKYLKKDDIIIDGGNSYYKDTVKRGDMLKEKEIYYLDCGTSGGVWGLKNGYSLMTGGDKSATDYVYPVYKTLAPADGGYVYCGERGAGHYVKMIHNGIEYGLMQAYGEGFEILKKSKYNLDLAAIAHSWLYGSVVRSWLLELAADALKKNPQLDGIKSFVPDSGESRWTLHEAVDLDVPAHIMASSLFQQFSSRQRIHLHETPCIP
jgi:6-phosphogluconate dehydrogenase (decarboxylating) (EC 1.1.1.44)